MFFEMYIAGWDTKPIQHRAFKTRLNGEQHQQWFERMKAAAYRPTSVTGHQNMFGTSLYSSVWEKNDGRAWATQHGIRASDYQQSFDTFVRDGYYPICVNGYGGPGGVRFNSVWERAEGRNWAAQHGIADHSYQRVFDEMINKGLRPRSVSVYQDNGSIRYTGVWDNSPSSSWVARHGLNITDFNATTDDLNQRGYILVSAGAVKAGGKDVFTGIWEQASGATAETRQAMNHSTLLRANSEMVNRRLSLRYLIAYNGIEWEDRILNFRIEPQGKSNWCWVACASSIANFYRLSGGWNQCRLVNLDFNQTICCNNGTNGLPCNNGGDLGRILGKLGLLARRAGQLSYAEIERELLASRPIGMHIAWRTGGEHVMVLTGCQSGQMVRISDPSGNGSHSWVPYTQMINNTGYNWTGSALTKKL